MWKTGSQRNEKKPVKRRRNEKRGNLFQKKKIPNLHQLKA